jgi:prepilin-type processing-associated H-X9-DG protein
LVVIAIIGVMVGLLLPAVQSAREAARRMSCGNNLKNIGLALHNYHDVHNKFPVGHQYRGHFDGNPLSAEGGTGFGWATGLLQFIEQGNQFDRFDPRYPAGENTITRNRDVCQTPLALFSCPSDTKPPQWNDGAIPNSATSSYQGAGTSYDGWAAAAVGGSPNPDRFNGVFCRDNRGRTVGFRDVLDGTTNTIIVAETKWEMDNNRRNRSRIYAGKDITDFAQGATNALLVNGQWAMNWTAWEGNPQPHRTASSDHPGGATFAFTDGSVRFISETVQHTATPWSTPANAYDRPNRGEGYGIYQRLFSISDGLVIGEY